MFDIEKTGRRISVLRRERGMTQMELANLVGVSYQAVSNWERGVSAPDIGNLEILANALETTADDIICDEKTAAVIKAVENGETITQSLDAEEFFAAAPMLTGEQNDRLFMKTNFGGKLDAEKSEKIIPNLSFEGSFSLEYGALAEKLYNDHNVAMFSVLIPKLPRESFDVLINRAADKCNVPFFATLAVYCDAVAMEKFAERFYDEGDTALFAVCVPHISGETKRRFIEKAVADGNTAAFAVLSSQL